MGINTDQEWVREIKNGNEEAITQLWAMLYTDGVAIARKYNQDEDVGRDAAVSAYHRICDRGVAQFKFQSSFRSFCWVILTRELYRLISDSRSVNDLPPHVVGEENVNLPNQSSEVWTRLQPCLEKLTANRRKVFELIDLQGKRPDEVAEMLDISRNNVNQLALRARSDLKKCLQQHGFLTSAEMLSL